METLAQKIVISLLALVVLLSPLSLNPTRPNRINEAHAQLPVTGAGGFFNSILTLPSIDFSIAAIAGNTAAETSLSYKNFLRSLLLETLKKRLLDEMVSDIIDWINGGGEPRFIGDWDGFLAEAGNRAAGDFLLGTDLAFLCSPFSAELRFALLQTRTFRNAARCTLDQVVNNLDAFMADFSQGGWLAYQTLAEPQNNFFGAYLITAQETLELSERAAGAAALEGLAGQGILSTKSCEESGDVTDPSSGTDIDRDGDYGDIASTCTITTPGTVVGDLVKKAVGIDFDFIVNANELSQYVSSITNALINRLIRVGVEGLRGITSTANKGSDFVREGPCLDLTGDLLTACINYQSSLDSSFELIKAQVESDILNSLTLRQKAKPLLADTLLQWQNHLAYLADKESQSPTCVEADMIIETRASVLEIGALINSNNQAIGLLESAQLAIATIPDKDWEKLQALQTSIATVADSQAAQNLLDVAKAKKELAEEMIANNEEKIEQSPQC